MQLFKVKVQKTCNEVTKSSERKKYHLLFLCVRESKARKV